MNKKLLFAIALLGISLNIYAQCVQCAGSYTLPGVNASVLGTGCDAAGHSALSSGYESDASGNYSTALGHHANASGIYSVAIGKNVTAQDSAFVFGLDISATAINSLTIGSGFSSTSKLTNNIPNSIMLGINSSTPGITIRQDSQRDTPPMVGIGTTNPRKSLHVNGTMMLSGTGNSLLFASSSASNHGDFGIKLTNNGLNFFLPNNGNPTENLLYINNNGNIGIGTSNPKQMLHVVEGNILISRVSAKNDKAPGSVNGSMLFGDVTTTQYPYGSWGIEYLNDNNNGYGLNFWKTTDANGSSINYVLFLCEEGNYLGNVGIGTSKPKHKLSVNGTIQSKEVIVTTLATDWPDFVFDNNHNLMSLKETERFIKQNGHLPNVPSATEVEEEGVKLGEMNAILLQKVEELTLYVIELQKQIDELKGDKR